MKLIVDQVLNATITNNSTVVVRIDGQVVDIKDTQNLDQIMSNLDIEE